MASKRPYLRLYVADLLLDERWGAMEPIAKGAFIEWLLRSWASSTPGVGSLTEARTQAGLKPYRSRVWARVWPQLKPYFDLLDDNHTIVQPRLLHEYECMCKESNRQQQRRAKGARNTAMSATTQTQTQTQTKEESKTRRSALAADPRAFRVLDLFEMLWSDYPKKAGKQAGWKAWQAKTKGVALDDLTTFAAEVAAGLDRWTEWYERQQTQPQFMLHFSTMVNQERWKEVPGGSQ